MRRAVFGILCCLSLPAMASEPILRDRDPGAHVIEYEVTLDAPPDEVFRLWSTADGLQQFLAPGARVGATVGSLYQITFDPEGDPEGAKHGTKGARLLHILPGKELAAEWTFPPLGEKLNTPPFPTWIEVRFASAPGAPGRTRLHFAHYGFADDPDWKQAFDFFATGNWPLIRNRLIVLCRDGVTPAWADDDGEQIDLFLRKEILIDAPLENVWRAWTTKEGVRFTAEGARIDLTPGGPYEWYFSMGAPEGSRGGEGNTVLSVDPTRFLAFEWNAPPSFPDVRKQKHQILLQLAHAGEDGTHLILTALGFGPGQQWKEAHAYFDGAWDTVVDRLKTSLETGDSSLP